MSSNFHSLWAVKAILKGENNILNRFGTNLDKKKFKAYSENESSNYWFNPCAAELIVSIFH